MDKNDITVGSGLVGAPACGDGAYFILQALWNDRTDIGAVVMKLQIKVSEDGIISDVKFKTFGCGSAIASSSYMTERVKGLTLDQAGAIKNTEIAKELCLPPVKLHCSSKHSHRLSSTCTDRDDCAVLAEDAIKAAIKDYQTKRAAAVLAKASLASDVAAAQARSEISV